MSELECCPTEYEAHEKSEETHLRVEADGVYTILVSGQTAGQVGKSEEIELLANASPAKHRAVF